MLSPAGGARLVNRHGAAANRAPLAQPLDNNATAQVALRNTVHALRGRACAVLPPPARASPAHATGTDGDARVSLHRLAAAGCFDAAAVPGAPDVVRAASNQESDRERGQVRPRSRCSCAALGALPRRARRISRSRAPAARPRRRDAQAHAAVRRVPLRVRRLRLRIGADTQLARAGGSGRAATRATSAATSSGQTICAQTRRPAPQAARREPRAARDEAPPPEGRPAPRPARPSACTSRCMRKKAGSG